MDRQADLIREGGEDGEGRGLRVARVLNQGGKRAGGLLNSVKMIKEWNIKLLMKKLMYFLKHKLI